MAAKKINEENLQHAIEQIKMLKEDITVPKNVKQKLDMILELLGDKNNILLNIDKSITEFEEIAEDTNIEPFTRTQIWNIISMLEMLIS